MALAMTQALALAMALASASLLGPYFFIYLFFYSIC